MKSNHEFLTTLRKLLNDCRNNDEKEEMVFLRLQDVRNEDERLEKFAAVVSADLFSKNDKDLVRGLEEIGLESGCMSSLVAKVMNRKTEENKKSNLSAENDRPPERISNRARLANSSTSLVGMAGWEWPPRVQGRAK